LRKDTLCRELKERNDQLQEDMTLLKDKDGEVDKLKDQVKKLKLETEIKDN
jgi:cell shape-determining protein MreC